MGLRIVAGRSGTGKTTFCMQEIIKKQKDLQGRYILIVPEQFSSQAEMDLIAQSENKSILTAEVLSFGRLAYHIFSKYGIGQKTPMNDTGKAMILRKILLEKEGELRFFQKVTNKQGFVEQLSTTVTELFQYCITPKQLSELQENPQLNQMMRDKLWDLEKIYTAYEEFLQKEYLSGDTLLNILVEKLALPHILENTEIWLDGFYGFTPQEYQVIGKLLQLANQVTVTLTIDEDTLHKKEIAMSAPFYETFLSARKLQNLANEMGVKVEAPIILKDNLRLKRKALQFLEQNYFYGYGKNLLHCGGIRVFAASNKDKEIRDTAMQMVQLAKEYGFRYRQMAVVTNALSEYEKSIRGIFQEYDIPFFIDIKREIVSHPLVELIRSYLDSMVTHFSYESVFRYLKTGLSALSIEEVDLLENYVLAYGVKGYKWYRKPWEYGFREKEVQEQKEMNQLREMVIMPFQPFSGLNKKKKYRVEYFVTSLYQMLERLAVTDKLTDWAKAAKEQDHEARAKEHEQIWNIVMELLEKMVAILGKEEMTLAEFTKILEAGLVNSEMGMIPPTADSVLIADLERSRLPEIKALFVLGVNEGILPSANDVQGVFTEVEREALEGTGMELASGGKRHAFEEQFLIYQGITKPSHLLSFSYCIGDMEGKALRPSSVISNLFQLFPSLQLAKEGTNMELEYICSPIATFHALGKEMREAALGGEMADLWKDVFSYYNTNAQWSKRLSMLKRGLYAEREKEFLSPRIIKKMYGNVVSTSVSRLERFATCPFAYFLEYGLKAEQRRLYELKVPDLGLLFHEVLEIFSNTMTLENKSWTDITKEETEYMVDRAVDEAAPKLGNEILLDSAANRYLIQRLKRISKRAAWILVQHIKNGDFYPYGFEIGFGESEKLPPIVVELERGERLVLRGKIDRVDLMMGKESQYVKIIDYKSGKKDFNYQSVYYGLQLQLLIYMDAFLNQYSNQQWKPGGVFYFRIKDPYIQVTKEMDAEEIYHTVFKEMKMSGLVLDEPEVIYGLDHSFQVVDGKVVSGNSVIIPVGINKKDGSYKKSGVAGTSVAEEKQYHQMMSFAMKKAKEAGESILAGEVSPNPYKTEKEIPCQYCNYRSVCQFDDGGGKNYRVLKTVTIEDFKEQEDEPI